MDLRVYINGVRNTDLLIERLRTSYVRPWTAELLWPGRHDAPPEVELWDELRLVDEGGTTRFFGNLTAFRPGGVAREGVTYVASGKRFRLRNEPVRINGRGFYVWNRRGFQGEAGQGGEDSPGRDGGKWTAGEIIIDILEHALGLPTGGSDIGGHHGAGCCIRHTYLTEAAVAGYDAASILALDSVVGEFSVNNTMVADAISLLLGLNGGFYGWYVDPQTGWLKVVDLDALPETTIEAGELGHWQDESGTDYVLLGNELEWSLEGVCSTLIIQGTDRTFEEKPNNIEDSGNSGHGDRGELELVAAPWRDYPAAYRPLCQPKRGLTDKPIDEEGQFTPPEGYGSYSYLPRVYQGTGGGAKYVYEPSSGQLPTFLLSNGIIAFHEVPELGMGEELWAWYWARMPFRVVVGPEGDAFEFFGYQRTRTVYDPAFRHPTSWPRPGTEDDMDAMEQIGRRLLRLFRDVRRQGRFRCDRVDFDAYCLDNRYNVANLGPPHPATSTSTTTSAVDPGDPTAWDALQINAVEVVYEVSANATEITMANTFWMLEGYSELKRRLELNLFAGQELALSQDILDSQVNSSSSQDDGEDNQQETTSGATTTEGGTTTEGPTTSTTTGAATTTTEVPQECPTAEWCTGDCPYEVRCDVPAFSYHSGGNLVECDGGTLVWCNNGAGCKWVLASNSTGCAFGDLSCTAGLWHFSGPDGTRYEQPASAGSCPMGLYSQDESAEAPADLGVYS